MARWGRKGLGWYVQRWWDGNIQLPKKSNASWKGSRWSESTHSFVHKKRPMYGTFKPVNIEKKVGRIHSISSSGRKGSKKLSWKHKLSLILILFLLATVGGFVYMEKNLREPLMHVAKIRIKQIATQAINGAVAQQVATRVASESLIDWKMDSGGKVSGFMLNYNEHMRITASTIATVQGTLHHLQHVPERIPLGHALDSAIISNYGPKIPVSFEPLGAVKVELNTREKNAAINMVLVEVYIKVITEVAIIIPFDMEPEVVETEIPISYLLVVGDVPMYYYDSSGRPVGESAHQAPNIAVPLQPGQGISSRDASSEGGSNHGTTTEGGVQHQDTQQNQKQGESNEGMLISP